MPGILGGQRAAAQRPCPSHGVVKAVEYPAAGTQRPPPEPDSPPVAGARRTSLPRNRRLRKKILTPVILVVVGIALGIIALVLYPSRTQLPTPTYSTLHLLSHLSAGSVTYQVY